MPEEMVGELVCGGWGIFGGGIHAGDGGRLQRTGSGSKDIRRRDFQGDRSFPENSRRTVLKSDRRSSGL
jgi:hypothetical protein